MRIARLVALVALVVALIASSCASTLPQKLPETMKQSCALYQEHRQDVVNLRAYAASHWDAFPPEIQKLLTQADQILPTLDQIGQASCDLSTITLPSNFTWDTTLALILKLVDVALQFKAGRV